MFEIENRKQEIPETRFISELPKALFSIPDFEKKPIMSPEYILGISIMILLATHIFFAKNNLNKLISLYIIGYLFLHIAFPAYLHRYFYPILLMAFISIFYGITNLYFLINKSEQYKGISFNKILAVVLVLFSILQFNQVKEYVTSNNKWDVSQKYAAEWLDSEIKKHSNKNIDIYTHLPFSIIFFMDLGIGKSEFYSTEFRFTGPFYHTKFEYTQANRTITVYDLNAIQSNNCFNYECLDSDFFNTENESFLTFTTSDHQPKNKINDKNLNLIHSHSINRGHPITIYQYQSKENTTMQN